MRELRPVSLPLQRQLVHLALNLRHFQHVCLARRLRQCALLLRDLLFTHALPAALHLRPLRDDLRHERCGRVVLFHNALDRDGKVGAAVAHETLHVLGADHNEIFGGRVEGHDVRVADSFAREERFQTLFANQYKRTQSTRAQLVVVNRGSRMTERNKRATYDRRLALSSAQVVVAQHATGQIARQARILQSQRVNHSGNDGAAPLNG